MFNKLLGVAVSVWIVYIGGSLAAVIFYIINLINVIEKTAMLHSLSEITVIFWVQVVGIPIGPLGAIMGLLHVFGIG